MDVTEMLIDTAAGNRSAADGLMPLVYDELRGLARSHMQRERSDHTLQTTALVNEAYLRLIDQRRADGASRTHFMALASMAFRRVLWDHAKARDAGKRFGGKHRVLLHDDVIGDGNGDATVLALDLVEALEKLQTLHARQAQGVELRFFAGLADHEIADQLGVSRRTVVADWRTARAWIRRELSQGQDAG